MMLSILYFGLYLLTLVAIGAVSARRETEDDFMIAERQVHGVQIVATMTAGMFDGAILARATSAALAPVTQTKRDLFL